MLYDDKSTISMYKLVKKSIGCVRIVIEKQIVYQFDTLHVDYYVNQKCISPEILGLKQLTYSIDTTEITNTIQMFECLRICSGGPSTIDFPCIYFPKSLIKNYIAFCIINLMIFVLGVFVKKRI